MRVIVLALLSLTLSVSLGFAQGARRSEPARLALVIGNSDYNLDGERSRSDDAVRSAFDAGFLPDLLNPSNDARDVAATLRELGYEVDERYDLNRDAMVATLDGFASKANRLGRRAHVVLYYSGHGIGVGTESFLVPVSAQVDVPALAATPAAQRQQTLTQSLVPTADFLARFESMRSDMRMVIFDSCRDNPWVRNLSSVVALRAFGRSLLASSGRGLAASSGGGSRPNTPILVYSTGEDKPADDGTGSNSPFAAALMTHLQRPNVDVRTMLTGVRTDVMRATTNKQVPLMLMDSSGAYQCFSRCGRK